MPRSLQLYLEDVLDEITRINDYVGETEFSDFSHDRKTQDAVFRNLEIIGEAVKNLPDITKQDYPYEWRAIAGLRDVLIHQYSGVSIPLIWDIVTTELPGLKTHIEKILKAIQG